VDKDLKEIKTKLKKIREIVQHILFYSVDMDYTDLERYEGCCHAAALNAAMVNEKKEDFLLFMGLAYDIAVDSMEKCEKDNESKNKHG